MEFLLYFLPAFFLFYCLTPDKFKNVILVIGSLIFYAYGEPKFLLLLIFSVYLNYYVGLSLGNDSSYKKIEYEEAAVCEETSISAKTAKRKKLLLTAAVVCNVGVLMFFKVKDNAVGLPLGLSFYTFQVLSYLFDIYRGTVKTEKSLLRFAVCITMFPKLISGPLVSYGDIRDKLSRRRMTAAGLQDGLKIFTVGLVLKVLLADRVGILWHEVQVTGFESISTPLAWLAALAYSLKIYFDFYGYSLMAVGLGKMLGFSLPRNFKTPYMAKSVRDFYRRWHITLGRWFRDYVYIPLGGSRKGAARTALNLLAVWFLTAVWHGSSLNFLLWGGMLWGCIVLERLLEKSALYRRLRILPRVGLWFVITVSWMCFAITDMEQLSIYLGRMFGLVQGIRVRAGDWLDALKDYGLLLVVAMLGTTPLFERLYRRLKRHLAGIFLLALLFWICIQRLVMEGDNPFMYFRY